jgi:hypothetical protein
MPGTLHHHRSRARIVTEINKGNRFWKHESRTVFFTAVVRLALTQTFRCSKTLLKVHKHDIFFLTFFAETETL